MNVYVNAAHSTAAAGNYASIGVNALTAYSASNYTLLTAAAQPYSFHGNLVQGASLTQAPMGYGSLSALYTNYRVLSYTIKVTITPQVVSDILEFVVIPMGFEELPSSSAAAINLRVLASQPRARSRVCEASCPAKDNTITLSGTLWDLVGQRREQWMDQAPTAVTSSPNPLAFVGIFMQQLNGSNNSQTINVRIELVQTVEFTDLLNPIN